MKTVFQILILVTICALMTSCPKNTPTPDHPYGEGKGAHTFWCSGINILYPVVVKVYDQNNKLVKHDTETSDSITYALGSEPDCKNTSSIGAIARYIDTAGNYTFTAESSDSAGPFTWKGSFTIYPDACHTDQMNGSCDMSIGNWEKMENGTEGNSAGVVIFWNGVEGKVVANPNNSCLAVGSVVWKNLDGTDCKIDFLDCNLYLTGSINIATYGLLYINGIKYYRR
jgi:hypothetical protein